MYTQLQLRDSDRPPVTLSTLDQMKQRGEKIACLTCYDASFAALLDAAGVDVVLAGDSLGMVIQGHDTTVPVTMDHMVYHSAAVARGLRRPFFIADLPFMSYPSRELALANAVRLMQQGGARMVKLEIGKGQTEIVEFLAGHDIAVCAHLGLKHQLIAFACVFCNRLPEILEGDEPQTGDRLARIAVLILACIVVAHQAKSSVRGVPFGVNFRILREVADGGDCKAVHDCSLAVVLRDEMILPSLGRQSAINICRVESN